MSPPRPLRHAASTPAERQVALAAGVSPRPLDRSGWDEVLARSALAAPRPSRLAPAFALSVALGAALVLLLRPAPPPAVAPVQLAVAEDVDWAWAPSGAVTLRVGRMRVSGGETVRLETPDAVLVASRARFLAEVTAAGTFLSVEEGEVTLRAGEVVRVVRAGEALSWPPAPDIPLPLLAPVSPAPSRCDALDAAARPSCLRAEAAGDSLEAQAALFELGVLELGRGHAPEAVAAWRESLRRFPDGVLHPEVRLALLVELVRLRRFTEADEVATGFEASCADDPRLGDVVALRRALPAR